MNRLEKEVNLISVIIMINTEIRIVKFGLIPAFMANAMRVSIAAQYAAHVRLMRQNGATFTDILTMLMEQEK